MTITEAAREIGTTEKNLKRRLSYKGLSTKEPVDMVALNLSTIDERQELSDLYFTVKDLWGFGFYSDLAKWSATNPHAVRRYFNDMAFKDRDTALKYTKVLKDMLEYIKELR